MLMREVALSYLSNLSWERYTLHRRERQTVRKPKNPVFQGLISKLPGIESIYSTAVLYVYFSRHDTRLQLKTIFTIKGLSGMLEDEDFKSRDMVFPYVAGCASWCTSHQRMGVLPEVHAIYSGIMKEAMIDRRRNVVCKAEKLQHLKHRAHSSKRSAVYILELVWSAGLHALEFHIIDHLVTGLDLDWFKTLEMLEESTFHGHNMRTNKAYRETSGRRCIKMDETMTQLLWGIAEHNENDGNAPEQSQLSCCKKIGRNGPHLVPDGRNLLVMEIKNICFIGREKAFQVHLVTIWCFCFPLM